MPSTRRAAAAVTACLALIVTAVVIAPSTAPAGAQETGPPPNSVTAHGEADHFGPNGGMDLNRPLVGMARTVSGEGYWLVASDGGIFTFGDAAFHGSAGGIDLNEPIVAMAADPTGGYRLVASDGGVFTFGGAAFHGSMGGQHLNQPVVGIASTPTGQGYWLVARDGGIFTFGDAGFHGSAGNIRLNRPIVAMSPTVSGRGYWLVASDGGIFSYGDAEFHGSMGDRRLVSPIVGMATQPTGGGYWLAAEDGGVFSFGSAEFHGNAVADARNSMTVAIAPHPSGAGYWLAHARPEPQVVATFTTPLQPGQSRNQNIRQAARYLDGSVIDPGERFSLNEAIGRRTRERGFVSNGYIQEDGDTGTTVGGGVSQMGTTFLNVAWFSGIDLVEFKPHSIYFERYPMCREATLDWGTLDVVVINDSPYHITVRSSATDESVTVTFFSRPWASVDSWTGEPYDIEGGEGGAFSVRCGRTVTYPDGSQSSDTYAWRYRSGYPG